MKTFRNNMNIRRAMLSLPLIVAVLVLAGCKTQGTALQRQYAEIEAPQPTLYDDAATNWANQHVGALINKYVQTAGNKLDPDEIRSLFMPIGYDGGTNTLKYRAAEAVMVDTIYQVMLQRAIDRGQRSVVIFTGPSASGKSTATKNMDFSKVGVVYDGALNGYESLVRRIDQAKQAGISDVTVIALYNTIRNCFRNSIDRGAQTNRFIHVPYMISSFGQNQGKMARVMQNYPDVKVVAIDKHDNENANIVPDVECKDWNFSVSQEDISVLFGYIKDEIEKGRLQPHQLAAIAGDIEAVPGLNTQNKALATQIATRIANLQKGVVPIQMILDSDFGSSTDDLFALMMLHHYIDEGRVNLKGIVVDREGEKNAQLVDVLNHYYGHPDIPVGLERNGVKNPRCFIPYSGIVDLKDKAGQPLFTRSMDVAKCPEGYKLYRQLLAKAADKSIVVVAIGFATTLAQLFESGADEYSPLNGTDLFGQKVKAVYIQSGRFESGDSLSGYNMRAASRQSKIFYDKLPKNIDLLMSPSNVGDLMNYPPQDVLVDLSNTEKNPIKAVYTYYTCDTGQRMWDTNCLVQAVEGDEGYNLSPRGFVTFVDKGEESLMLFRKDEQGNARYQLPGDTYFAEEKLMDIRRHTRMNANPAPYTIEAPQPQLIRSEAADWAKERLGQLTDKYLGSAGNKLDPDDVRMLFRPLGYTGPNAADYAEAEAVVEDAVFERMLDKALRAGKKDLVIVTGAPGCGKSTAARSLNLRGAGLIYDAVLDGPDRLQQVVAKAKAAGMEKVVVVPVYNDIVTSFKNTVARGNSTWRYTGIGDMVAAFRGGKGRIAQLSKAFPDVQILPVDCSNNQGVKRVSLAKAQNWNYDISDAEMNILLSYLHSQIADNEIEGGSVPMVADGLDRLGSLSSKNAALVRQINEKVEAIMQAFKMR